MVVCRVEGSSSASRVSGLGALKTTYKPWWVPGYQKAAEDPPCQHRKGGRDKSWKKEAAQRRPELQSNTDAPEKPGQWSSGAQSWTLESGRPELEFRFCHSWPVSPLAGHLTSPFLFPLPWNENNDMDLNNTWKALCLPGTHCAFYKC